MDSYIKYFIVVGAIIFTSCENKGREVEADLAGKIAYWEKTLPGKSGYESWRIYDNGKFSKIILRNSKDTTYKLRQWMNTMDFFLASQSVHLQKSRYSYKTKNVTHKVPKKENLVLINLEGEIQEVIYSTDYFEAITDAYFAPSDDNIMIILSKYGESIQEIAPISSSLLLVDFKSKAIVKRIDNFELSTNLTFNESPWSPDGTRIVYGIGHAKIITRDEPISKPFVEEGLYILDLVNGDTKLIVSKGNGGVWSPVDEKIAYVKNGDLWIYDVKHQSSHIFYKSKSFEDLSRAHWSPDGRYLRIHGWRYASFGYLVEKPFDKLLRVDNGEEVLFNRIGGASYTWK